MLKSACILTPRSSDDGIRISVMSRHTQNDGQTPDERITDDLFDQHGVALAPPAQLVGQWYRQAINWDQFTIKYQLYLACHPEARIAVMQLIALALKKDVTVLCIEETPERCHRRLLIEYCQHLNSSLIVEIH